MSQTMEFPAAAVDEGTTDKRKLALIGGVALLVLAGGGWFLLGHGSGGSEGPKLGLPAAAPAHTTAAKPAAKGKPAVKGPTLVPAASNVKLGRDPFHALYMAPVPSAAGAGGATSPSSPVSTPGSAGTGGGGTTQPVDSTYALRLTRVYGAGKDLTAVFSVGGKTQTAKVGSVFGRSSELKLLSLQQGSKGIWTAVLQEGDGDPFDAPAGGTFYVK